jgi:hypothetical protein
MVEDEKMKSLKTPAFRRKVRHSRLFACLVEGSGKSSNFHTDVEAIVSAKHFIRETL